MEHKSRHVTQHQQYTTQANEFNSKTESILGFPLWPPQVRHPVSLSFSMSSSARGLFQTLQSRIIVGVFKGPFGIPGLNSVQSKHFTCSIISPAFLKNFVVSSVPPHLSAAKPGEFGEGFLELQFSTNVSQDYLRQCLRKTFIISSPPSGSNSQLLDKISSFLSLLLFVLFCFELGSAQGLLPSLYLGIPSGGAQGDHM